MLQLDCARMAELVYAFDLKSNGEIHMGSSPISGTNETPQVMQIIWEASPLRYKSHFGHEGEKA